MRFWMECCLLYEQAGCARYDAFMRLTTRDREGTFSFLLSTEGLQLVHECVRLSKELKALSDAFASVLV